MEDSYFNYEELIKKADYIRDNNLSAHWLPEVIRELANSSDNFPVEEDTDRYTVEYIYPH